MKHEQNNASDLSDEQWHIIQPLLPKPSRRRRPQTIYRREIINVIESGVHDGCCCTISPSGEWSTQSSDTGETMIRGSELTTRWD